LFLQPELLLKLQTQTCKSKGKEGESLRQEEKGEQRRKGDK